MVIEHVSLIVKITGSKKNFNFFSKGAELGEDIRNECIAAYEMFTEETNDGLLGTIELDKVLRMLAQEPSAQELKSVMDEFATSDTGKMSMNDFLDLMERQLLSTMKGEEDLSKVGFFKLAHVNTKETLIFSGFSQTSSRYLLLVR